MIRGSDGGVAEDADDGWEMGDGRWDKKDKNKDKREIMADGSVYCLLLSDSMSSPHTDLAPPPFILPHLLRAHLAVQLHGLDVLVALERVNGVRGELDAAWCDSLSVINLEQNHPKGQRPKGEKGGMNGLTRSP